MGWMCGTVRFGWFAGCAAGRWAASHSRPISKIVDLDSRSGVVVPRATSQYTPGGSLTD